MSARTLFSDIQTVTFIKIWYITYNVYGSKAEQENVDVEYSRILLRSNINRRKWIEIEKYKS